MKVGCWGEFFIVLANGNAFSNGKIGAARKRGFESEIRDLCGHEKGNCSFLT